jgi:hypothetical protein
MCAFCIPLAPFTLLAPSFEGSLEGSFEGCATPGRPRRAFPNKSPLAVRLLPPWCPASAVGACGYSSFPHESRVTNHESQSLPSLSFQPITNCPFSKSFVLITIQQYPGWVGGPPGSNLLTFKLATFKRQHSDRARRNRVHGFFSLSPVTSHLSLATKSFTCNTYEPLATVDSKRLTQTLSPLDATLTKTGGRDLRLYRARRREGS